MGLEPASWIALGSLALTAVSTFSSLGSANRQAARQAEQTQAQYDAAGQEYVLQGQQIAQQREDTNTEAAEQKSDRMRRAIYELGALQTGVSESGLGASTAGRIEAEAAYAGGVDLSRIENNRVNRQRSYDLQSKQVELNYDNRTKQTYADARMGADNVAATKTSAVLGAVGASLQLGDKMYSSFQTQKYRENMEDIARRRADGRQNTLY